MMPMVPRRRDLVLNALRGQPAPWGGGDASPEDQVMGGFGQDTMIGAGEDDPFAGLDLDPETLAVVKALAGDTPAPNAAPVAAPAAAPPAPEAPAFKPAEMPVAEAPDAAPPAKPLRVPDAYSDKTIQERTADRVLQGAIYNDVPPEELTELERRLNTELLSTDATRKNNLYADAMAFANEILDNVDTEGQDWFAENFTGDSPLLFKLPGGIGNKLVGSKRQAYEMAKRMWITAKLRPETGATINYTAEEPPTRRSYFPEYGDDAATVDMKRRARQAVLDSTVAQAGPLYKPQNLRDYLPEEYWEDTPVGGEAPDDAFKDVSDEDLLKMFMSR
jgi:hypothetical protein